MRDQRLPSGYRVASEILHRSISRRINGRSVLSTIVNASANFAHDYSAHASPGSRSISESINVSPDESNTSGQSNFNTWFDNTCDYASRFSCIVANNIVCDSDNKQFHRSG